MKTANAQIVESTPAPAGLSVVPELEVSWDRARTLWSRVAGTAEEALRSAATIIELAEVLAHLRAAFFNQGGDHCSEAFKKQTSANGRLLGVRGWQETVREMLGISHQTALRLIDQGYATMRLKALAEGEDVQWKHSKGEVRMTEATEESVAKAREVLVEVVAGTVPATRAWAGVCGEGARLGQGGVGRAAVDHAGVMLRAIRSVKAALKQWPDLPPDDRYDVEMAWHDLLEVVPAEFLRRDVKGARK